MISRNPAPLAAARASETFCVAAERSEDSLAHIELQDRNVAIGVDIGLCGAVAIFDANSGLIAVHDVPCLDGVRRCGRAGDLSAALSGHRFQVSRVPRLC